MRNLLIGLATAVLVFAGLAAAGFAAAPLLLPAPPNVYRTSLYSITLPTGWTCMQEVTEQVCRPEGPPPYRAQLIATAKFRNPEMDTLDAYTAHLEKPKSGRSADGRTMVSTVEKIGRTVIEGRTWVDGAHFESEIRGYRTRYLATVTAQAAILISFSSYKDDFDTYQPVFERMVRNLDIYQRHNGDAAPAPG